MNIRYAYCEQVTAGPHSPWHIRRVGDEGILPGGGVPAPICQPEWWLNGWDLPDLEPSVEEIDRQGSGVCQRCIDRFQAISPEYAWCFSHGLIHHDPGWCTALWVPLAGDIEVEALADKAERFGEARFINELPSEQQAAIYDEYERRS